MAIPVSCPTCGQAGNVPDKAVGHRAKCPKCGQDFDVALSTTPMSSFTCPRCNSQLSAPHDLAGKLISCPTCNEIFAPLSGDTLSPDFRGEDYGEYVQPRSAVNPAFLLTGALLFAVIITLLVVFLNQSAKPKTIEEQAKQQLKEGVRTAAWTMTFLLVAAIVIAYIVGVILMLAWVARDSRARGVDGGAVWVLLILITSWIGLIVYMASRPHGILVVCNRCNNKKLMYAKACPHCGQLTEFA